MAKLRLLKTGHGDLTLAEWDKDQPETVTAAESAFSEHFTAGPAGVPARRPRPHHADPPVRPDGGRDPDRPGDSGWLSRMISFPVGTEFRVQL